MDTCGAWMKRIRTMALRKTRAMVQRSTLRPSGGTAHARCTGAASSKTSLRTAYEPAGARRAGRSAGFALHAGARLCFACKKLSGFALRDGKTIVFAEVKTRAASSAYGLGREAVTAAKQRNIAKAAAAYLAAYSLYDACVRFDVLEVDAANNSVTHIPGAFTL